MSIASPTTPVCERLTTPRSPLCKIHFSKAFDRSEVISAGSTAIIERLPCGHVRKSPFPDDTPRRRNASLRDIEREHEVYKRLMNQAHFLEMVEFSAEEGIILQGMPDGTLRDYLRSQGQLISTSKRLSWAYDVATSLHSLHMEGVIHADLKPENILLDERCEVYLIDFSGSCIDGRVGTALESVRFFLPRDPDSESTVQTDLFALGSTLYEIMTGEEPYCNLADEVVERRFQQGLFPSVAMIPSGEIITQCWEGKVHTAHEVCMALQGRASEFRSV
jgi:serine/threonine protein kinase